MKIRPVGAKFHADRLTEEQIGR